MSCFIIAMILFIIFFFTKSRVVQCEIYLKILHYLVFILITFLNILFTNKQIKKNTQISWKKTMKGKFQICIIVNTQWDTIKNVEVMFGSICHVVRLLLRDYPSVVVLMKMPYLVNMTIWSTLPILNDKWQMI